LVAVVIALQGFGEEGINVSLSHRCNSNELKTPKIKGGFAFVPADGSAYRAVLGGREMIWHRQFEL
jgi:hypothetical protein